MRRLMRKIRTEEPNDHWRFLYVKDKVVLDLGCALFYSTVSTSEWFINQGAKKVIGIDVGPMKINSDKFTMVVQTISSTEQLQKLIDEHQPDVIKCDIEGAEKYFDKVDMPDKVIQFAVEYHDANTKNVCETALRKWGFTNTELYQLMDISTARMGVLNSLR